LEIELKFLSEGINFIKKLNTNKLANYLGETILVFIKLSNQPTKKVEEVEEVNDLNKMMKKLEI